MYVWRGGQSTQPAAPASAADAAAHTWTRLLLAPHETTNYCQTQKLKRQQHTHGSMHSATMAVALFAAADYLLCCSSRAKLAVKVPSHCLKNLLMVKILAISQKALCNSHGSMNFFHDPKRWETTVRITDPLGARVLHTELKSYKDATVLCRRTSCQAKQVGANDRCRAINTKSVTPAEPV